METAIYRCFHRNCKATGLKHLGWTKKLLEKEVNSNATKFLHQNYKSRTLITCKWLNTVNIVCALRILSPHLSLTVFVKT